MSFLTGTNTEVIYVNTASGTAKNTFTAEALINDTAGMGPQPVLPPYFFQPSGSIAKSLRITARGIISSTGTPTFQIIVRGGGAAAITGPILLQSAAVATGSGVANQVWELEGDLVLRTSGATGANSTIQGLGLLSGGAFPTVGSAFGGGASPGTVATLDTSITNFINISAVCSASSASNSITLLQLEVFGLN